MEQWRRRRERKGRRALISLHIRALCVVSFVSRVSFFRGACARAWSAVVIDPSGFVLASERAL